MKIFTLLAALTVLSLNSVSMAGYISGNSYYNDDTGSHTINDSTTYQSLGYHVDFHTTNNPGTHVNLVDGGSVRTLSAFGNSTIDIKGGNCELGVQAWRNSTVTMTGGSIGAWLYAGDNATIEMTGGSVELLWAGMRATVTMSGGSVGQHFMVQEYSTLYLNGTGFKVNGTPLVNGDNLKDFGTLATDMYIEYYTGIITGTLADGSVLNNEFRIYKNNHMYHQETGDLIIIPEPCSLLLLGFGGFALRRHKIKIIK